MICPVFKEYDALDSTNDEAKRLLHANALNGLTVIRAECQTAGRGTQGRVWASPQRAGLYFSIVHPFMLSARNEDSNPLPDIPLTPVFTLAAGIACAETLETLTGQTIQLKPINDLMVEGRKLGGILTESLISENRCRALITGIGINVFRHDDVETHCETEHRGNHPTSLQSCLPPHLFAQWHPDALMRALCAAIPLRVDSLYHELILNVASDAHPLKSDSPTFSELLARYETFRLPDYPLPACDFAKAP